MNTRLEPGSISTSPPASMPRPLGLGGMTRLLAHWLAPAACWIHSGSWASGLAALALQWIAAALAFVALRSDMGSPLLVTALWAVAQTVMAFSFSPRGVLAQADRTGTLQAVCAGVSAGASLLLLGLGWWGLTLVRMESGLDGGRHSDLVAVASWNDAPPLRGELVVATCPGNPSLAQVARIVALPGETFWQSSDRLCFPSTGCLPQRPLVSESSRADEALAVEVQGGTFYVFRRSAARQSAEGGQPQQVHPGEVAVRILNGSGSCGAESIVRLPSDLLVGRIVWGRESLLRENALPDDDTTGL